MTREDVVLWLNRYLEAWRSYEPAAIAALFTDDAEYRYHPYDEPVRGRDAIAASWREEDRRDEPDRWDARYEPVAVDGNVAVAIGTSTYFDSQGNVERVFHNNFVMEFDDAGRCRSFVEWYVERPSSGARAAAGA